MLLNRSFYTRDRLLGIGISLAVTLAGHTLRVKYGQFYSAPFFVALVVISNISGLQVGLFAALLFSAGSWLQFMDIDPARVYLNTVCLFLVAYLVGTLHRKARVLDTINGNMEMLWGITQTLDWLIRYWPSLNESARYKRVVVAYDMVVDLTTLVRGWKTIAEYRQAIEDGDRNSTQTPTSEEQVQHQGDSESSPSDTGVNG